MNMIHINADKNLSIHTLFTIHMNAYQYMQTARGISLRKVSYEVFVFLYFREIRKKRSH